MADFFVSTTEDALLFEKFLGDDNPLPKHSLDDHLSAQYWGKSHEFVTWGTVVRVLG